jgi:4-amino-4-deoxy-L-arabinose transferase-like glycosyltransferase
VNTISSSVGKYPRSLLLLLVVGMLLRVLFIAVHERPLYSDEKEYDQLAYNLATKANYTYDTSPTAYRPIGYPAFVGFIYFIFGHHLIPVKLLQALVDTLISLLIYLLLVGRPERARVLGAALWAFFPPAVFYSNLLLSETMFTFFFVLVIWMLTRNNVGGTWQAVVLGGLLGILTLIKPAIVVFVLVLPLLMRQLEIPLRKLYPITVAFILVLSPWLVRNYLVFGEFALSSNGGINLMIGNNASATGAYRYPVDQSHSSSAKDEFEADHEALRAAAGYIAGNPVASVINALKKIGRLFESEGGLLVMTFHDAPEDGSTHYVTKYASLPLPWILLTNFCYFIIMIAAIFGLFAAEKGRLWWIVISVLVSWLVVHAVFFGGGRFHFPLMPLAATYAALFLSEPGKRYQALSRFHKGMAFSALAILCTLWFIEGYVVFHG